MKTLLHIPVLMALTVTALQASPLWTSNRDEEYLLSSDKDMSRFSAGFNLERNDRLLTYTDWRNGFQYERLFKFARYKGYVGFDLLPWLTVYGTGGGCRIGVGYDQEVKEFAGGDTEYGGGFRVNILDHIILDPLVMEDRVRLTASVQYTRSSFEVESIDHVFDWNERRGTVQLSIVNDIPASFWFHPESIALNLGIVYSDIEGSHNIDEANGGWSTVGLELFYSKRITVDASMYFSNDNETRGMTAGVHLRF